MNKLFRNIKENQNLDALEESDDEEEFENINEDKFVYLEREFVFKCKYLKKFNMWVPIKLDKDALVSNNYMTKVVEELAKSSPKFNEIRQIIANANVKDFEVFYRFLFDNASDFAPGKEGTVAIHINEYSFQSNFRIDKEINCMALIKQLINI